MACTQGELPTERISFTATGIGDSGPSAATGRVGGPSEGPGEARSTGGHRRVLIMDDDANVREVTGLVLAQLGYEATFAADGREAIAKYRDAVSRGHPFCLVLLDLSVRHGMGGVEAIDALRESDPGVKGIVMSGYALDPAIADYARYGFAGALVKPYTLWDLSAELRRVLEE